ncbi:endogenous retrovirus group PABLB member 1 Env polyprotein-like [Stegostoma tigrinum]|uniref:endogenous retrovirus group PABLB member 1 Env polyprotein-like n=1 Tax=Stegostoma tigrinum TaxID=3053191 RepID=UPI0028701D01|nr:endogenous retrovirus group PABLB member 1 Env polyprotein-like [Stegostoma tigrinum]XP_059509500.1 endogenous retrovirus group PABLB member 1 Env polyprotein-like [Stegostoma tigrinum]
MVSPTGPTDQGTIDGLRVTPPGGQVNSTCFCNWNVSVPFQLGKSSCKVHQVAHEYSLSIPLNGTYWVCDTRAYPYLPGEQHEHHGAQGSGIERTLPPEQKGWSGCCYLAYLVPHVHIPKQVPWTRKERGKKRRKPRKVTETDRLFWTLFPPYGAARAGVEIQQLAASLEELANGTAIALSETQTQVRALTTEMIALRLVALQNRMALDFILAEKGVTRALIGNECCTSVPDESQNITNLSQHIRGQIDKIREAGNRYRKEAGWEWGSWGLTGSGNWLVNLAIYGLIIVVQLIIGLNSLKCLLARMMPASLTNTRTALFMMKTPDSEHNDDTQWREINYMLANLENN